MFLPSTITLKPGDSGDFVSELQRRLSAISLFDEANICGIYDQPTTNAVRQFQSTQGLQADGVAGPETIRLLNGVITGSADSAPSGTQEEEQKEATRFTLKDALLEDMGQDQTYEIAALEDAKARTNAAEPVQQPAEQKRPQSQPEQDAQSKAAEASQANIAQQSQMADQLLQQAQNNLSTHAGTAAREKGHDATAAVQKDQHLADQNAPQERSAASADIAAQKEQIAQGKPQEVAVPAKAATSTPHESYIESRMSNETVREVKHEGKRMAKAGVEHVGMPDGGMSGAAPQTGQSKTQEQTAQIGA
jgi:peptidoglycan hydrolase-like protein with peptidoglycan-binding domain